MRKIIIAALFLFIFVSLSAQDRNVNDYSIKSLQNYQYKASAINIQKLAFKNELQYAYNVTFTSMNLTVSARLSMPAGKTDNIKGIIIMLRGHQNAGNYYTGKGTENPAKTYLEKGWAVIAPDFLSYGSSSPAPSPSFLHQFYCTINAVELYKSLEQINMRYDAAVAQADRVSFPEKFKKIVLWGHSNGGQAALHFLTIIQKPVTTVLWAPVSLAFPDSAGHFGRGEEWARQFKNDYNAGDFSYLNYLDKIADGTRILLEQGDKDTSVPKSWNDDLSKAVEAENVRRAQSGREKINLRYVVYKDANHNLNPYWNTVLSGNAAFWDN